VICIKSYVDLQSSLLQTLSGEITYFEGKVRLYGSFCYVPQEACELKKRRKWKYNHTGLGIFSSSIKNNILFGEEYDHKLFQRVIHAAALEEDFAQWPHGVKTLVGDQGVMLSGVSMLV
jgi:ABC-type transport system involved in cytochrome bd biosynthesis fused ATPase/permease subunit